MNDLKYLSALDYLIFRPSAKAASVLNMMICCRVENAIVLSDEKFLGFVERYQLVNQNYTDPAQFQFAKVTKYVDEVQETIDLNKSNKLNLEILMKIQVTAVPVFHLRKLQGVATRETLIEYFSCIDNDTSRVLERKYNWENVYLKPENR